MLFCNNVKGGSFDDQTEAEAEREWHLDEEAYDTYIDHVTRLETTFDQEMREEFGLRMFSPLRIAHRKIESLGAEFYADRRATVEEARALHLLVMDRYVQAINADENLQPFLEVSPFTSKQVQIGIHFQGTNGRYADGTIQHIFNTPDYASPPNQNRLFYYIEDPFQNNSIEVLDETYEDAVKHHRLAPIKAPGLHVATDKEEEIDRFLHQFSQDMWKQHELRCWSIGGDMAGEIENVGAYFVAVRQATQEEARTLLLDIAHRLLESMNGNDKLKPYLAKPSFTIEDLKIRLCFRDKRYLPHRNGTMENVTLDKGKVTYYRRPYPNDLKVTPVDVPVYAAESYEEAVKIAGDTPKSKYSLFDQLRAFLKR